MEEFIYGILNQPTEMCINNNFLYVYDYFYNKITIINIDNTNNVTTYSSSTLLNNIFNLSSMTQANNNLYYLDSTTNKVYNINEYGNINLVYCYDTSENSTYSHLMVDTSNNLFSIQKKGVNQVIIPGIRIIDSQYDLTTNLNNEFYVLQNFTDNISFIENELSKIKDTLILANGTYMIIATGSKLFTIVRYGQLSLKELTIKYDNATYTGNFDLVAVDENNYIYFCDLSSGTIYYVNQDFEHLNSTTINVLLLATDIQQNYINSNLKKIIIYNNILYLLYNHPNNHNYTIFTYNLKEHRNNLINSITDCININNYLNLNNRIFGPTNLIYNNNNNLYYLNSYLKELVLINSLNKQLLFYKVQYSLICFDISDVYIYLLVFRDQYYIHRLSIDDLSVINTYTISSLSSYNSFTRIIANSQKNIVYLSGTKTRNIEYLSGTITYVNINTIIRLNLNNNSINELYVSTETDKNEIIAIEKYFLTNTTEKLIVANSNSNEWQIKIYNITSTETEITPIISKSNSTSTFRYVKQMVYINNYLYVLETIVEPESSRIFILDLQLLKETNQLVIANNYSTNGFTIDNNYKNIYLSSIKNNIIYKINLSYFIRSENTELRTWEPVYSGIVEQYDGSYMFQTYNGNFTNFSSRFASTNDNNNYKLKYMCNYNNTYIYATDEIDSIYRYTISDGNYIFKPIITGLNKPSGIALDNNGNLYCCIRGNCTIIKISQTDILNFYEYHIQKFIVGCFTFEPVEIMVDTQEPHNIYMINGARTILYKYSGTGIITKFIEGFNGLHNLIYITPNHIFCLDNNQTIINCNLYNINITSQNLRKNNVIKNINESSNIVAIYVYSYIIMFIDYTIYKITLEDATIAIDNIKDVTNFPTYMNYKLNNLLPSCITGSNYSNTTIDTVDITVAGGNHNNFILYNSFGNSNIISMVYQHNDIYTKINATAIKTIIPNSSYRISGLYYDYTSLQSNTLFIGIINIGLKKYTNFDATNNTSYWTETEIETNHSNKITNLLGTLKLPMGISKDLSSNILYCCDFAENKIYSWTSPYSGQPTVLTQLNTYLNNPSGIAINHLSNIIYICNYGSNNIIKYNINTNTYIKTIYNEYLNKPYSICIDNIDAVTKKCNLYVTNLNNNTIVKMDEEGNTIDAIVNTKTNSPAGLFVMNNGYLAYSELYLNNIHIVTNM